MFFRKKTEEESQEEFSTRAGAPIIVMHGGKIVTKLINSAGHKRVAKARIAAETVEESSVAYDSKSNCRIERIL